MGHFLLPEEQGIGAVLSLHVLRIDSRDERRSNGSKRGKKAFLVFVIVKHIWLDSLSPIANKAAVELYESFKHQLDKRIGPMDSKHAAWPREV